MKGRPPELGVRYLCYLSRPDYISHSSLIKGTAIFGMVKAVMLRAALSRSPIMDALVYYEHFAGVIRYLRHEFLWL